MRNQHIITCLLIWNWYFGTSRVVSLDSNGKSLTGSAVCGAGSHTSGRLIPRQMAATARMALLCEVLQAPWKFDRMIKGSSMKYREPRRR